MFKWLLKATGNKLQLHKNAVAHMCRSVSPSNEIFSQSHLTKAF